MSIILIFIGLLSGTLIGTVGVGGILLTPLLIYFIGTELHIAQATSSFSFLFTGLVGMIIYARQKSIDWKQVLWISVGIIPATLLGTKVNSILPTTALTIILAVLISFSGYNALKNNEITSLGRKNITKLSSILIGLGVGFGSSLTGTGGPVLLVPILLFIQFAPLSAVGISQAIQLPIAIFSTLGFILFGEIDFSLGISLGIIQSLGVILGGNIAHRLPQEGLRKVVAIILVGVGLFMIVRILI